MYPFVVILSNDWNVVPTQNAISPESDWDFVDNQPGTICRKDLSKRNCIWYLFMFPRFFTSPFWLFLKYRYLQTSKHLFILPLAKMKSTRAHLRKNVGINFFPNVSDIKSTWWNVFFFFFSPQINISLKRVQRVFESWIRFIEFSCARIILFRRIFISLSLSTCVYVFVCFTLIFPK